MRHGTGRQEQRPEIIRNLSMQLGEREFVDRTIRPVWRDDDGRQYVLDDDGETVFGVWLHPDEYQEPIIIEQPAT
jgi:hypothetical protein